ncbi:MAG: DNA polymerase III subunit gamma/tau [Neisseriales bacterium]|nr:MAG: DNA polymerase III subunit gamma/tau [Neisseriales bacterium]
MSYQVLARKWRPKNFDHLVGQEHVAQTLTNALNSNRLHHAYLLTGTRGVGKTTLARILAKSLNCEQSISAKPCCQCQVCLQIDQGNFIDLLEIDAASNTGVDHIRGILEDTQYAPSIGRFKIYLIDEAHMLSKSAFNAMLKTLEEPPGHVKFILATTDPNKLPITILSRCLMLPLRNMTVQQISQHLSHILDNEAMAYEANALTFLAQAAEGSMRDALSLLDQAIAYHPTGLDEQSVRTMLGVANHQSLLTLLTYLATHQSDQFIALGEALLIEGVSPSATLWAMAASLHQIALLQSIQHAPVEDDINRNQLLELARQLSPEDLQLYYQIVIHGRRDLALAPDEATGFLMTLLRLCAFQGIEDKPNQPQVVSSTTRTASRINPCNETAQNTKTLQNPDIPLASTHTPTLGTSDPQYATACNLLEKRQQIQQQACDLLENDPFAQTLKKEFGAVLLTETAKLRTTTAS